MTSSLEVSTGPGRGRPSGRSLTVTLTVLAVVSPLAWIVWFVTTPPEFTTNSRRASGATIAGTPLYVGMYNAPSGFDRTIRVTGVKVRARASAEVSIVPLLCRNGTVGVTTKPEQFCTDLIDPQGERFGAGDSVVIRVGASDAADVEVDRIRIGFQQDLRSATLPAGIAGATLSFSAPAR